MTKWGYEIFDCEGLYFDNVGEKGWELISVDNGIAYFKRPIVEDIEMPIEANAPLVELEVKQEILDKLKVVSDGLKFIEGYSGDWQQKIEEVLGMIND